MSMATGKTAGSSLAMLSGLALAAGSALAASSSTNYAIPWDVLDGGGGQSASANYTMQGSIAQAGPIGESSSAGYILQAGFHSPPDSDADLVRNFLDNCIDVHNTDQRNTNAGVGSDEVDLIGNLCDPDFNQDGTVNFSDLADLKAVFFTNTDPDIDLNGDNTVNFNDLAILKSMFFGPPGPSGLEP